MLNSADFAIHATANVPTHIPSFAAAGTSCETCHGSVRERDVMTREVVHNMKSCMACHTATKARNDCTTCHEEH